jgi:hypothetical protein
VNKHRREQSCTWMVIHGSKHTIMDDSRKDMSKSNVYIVQMLQNPRTFSPGASPAESLVGPTLHGSDLASAAFDHRAPPKPCHDTREAIAHSGTWKVYILRSGRRSLNSVSRDQPRSVWLASTRAFQGLLQSQDRPQTSVHQ